MYQAFIISFQKKSIAPTISGYSDNDSLHLHLEMRFDYEDFYTVSVFAGYKWENDTAANIQITAIPMAGIATGRTNGFLPGLELNIAYKSYTLYSENEYMLNFQGYKNDYFYSWTQFNRDVLKNVKAGVLAQSLRWYKTNFAIQRGIYAEYNKSLFTFDIYYFNLFTSSHFMMASASINF